MTGLSYEPKVVRGALLMLRRLPQPPLAVRFQFNPEKVTRRLSSSVTTSETAAANAGKPAAEGGGGKSSTLGAGAADPGHGQVTSSKPETMSFQIRLDSVTAEGAAMATSRRLGVLPALSALELMALPRSPDIAQQLAVKAGLTSGTTLDTPVLVFVWGRRAFPSRLTQLDIEEVEYNASLIPTQVVATVQLEVIRGNDLYSVAVDVSREALAASALVTTAVDVAGGSAL